MYQEPKRLPPPFELPQPRVLPVYLMAGFSSIGLGFLLYLVGQLGYVFVIYNVLLGLGLGSAISLGIRWGSYPLSVRRITAGASLLIYACFHGSVYLRSIAGVSGSYPNFLEFLAYRASEQTIVFGYHPGVWGIASLWLAEIGLTMYVAQRVANRTLDSIRLNAVPTEVTEFVLFLLFRGKGAADIEAELATRGWTQRQDVVRALDAADVAASLIRTSPTSSPETTN